MSCKIFLAAMVAAAMPLFTEGKQLTPEEAWARVVMQESSSEASAEALKPMSQAGRPTLALSHRSGSEASVYVFTPATGSGYYCVAATDAAPKALLGFSTTGAFDAANMPPAMRWWLDAYGEELRAANPSAVSDTDSVDLRPDIEPLVTSDWGQLAPFNALVPMIGTTRAPVGCVALSMAQCMRVEKWPAKGHGSVTYDWYDQGKAERLSLDFDTIAFDWDNMIDYYGQESGGTEVQRAAVAKLCYALGVSVMMQYNATGSSSSVSEAAEALVRYFDYAETVCYHDRDYYELEEWKRKIYAELAAGRPVPYEGESSEEGHAFVCDGYKTGGYFHFNWGWYGSNNGYFLLSALNPGRKEGQYEEGYNRHQSIITGLTPSYKSSKQIDDLYISGNFKTDYDKYLRTENGKVTLSGEYGIYSQSYAPATVILGLELTAKDGTVSHIESDSAIVVGGFRPIKNYTVSMDRFPSSGSYAVRPAFRQDDGTWRPIRAKLSEVRDLNMRVTSSRIIFGDSPDEPDLTFPELSLESPLFIGKEFCLRATIGNVGGEFYDDVYVALTDTAGKIVGVGPVMEIDVPRDATIERSWIGKLNATGGHTLTPGKYRLGLMNVVDYRYSLLSPTIDVELRSPSQAPTIYSVTQLTVDGAKTSETSPASVGESSDVALTVSCTQGYFGERVSLQVTLPYHSAVVMETDVRFVAALEGEPCTVSYEADFSSLDPATVYWVRPYGKDSGFLGGDPAYVRLSSSGITSVEAPASRLWPNPADALVNIEAPAAIESIAVFTLAGSPCSVPANIDGNTARLDVSSLPAGLYLVRLTTPAGPYTHRLLRR